MKKILSVVMLAMLWCGYAEAVPMLFSAQLSGAAENPPNISGGTGSALVTYDPILHYLTIDIDFTGLTGVTTASHIHCCTDAPGNIGVATPTPSFPGFPAGVVSGMYDIILDLTQTTSFNPSFVSAQGGTLAAAEQALIDGLGAGRAYLNIHTVAATGGEIRGFFQPVASVPEPVAIALLTIGLGGFLLARRKQLA
ncbi:MAG: CHRD domain-containing protein [Chromatiaceae bacterium]|nr:CHRD domain-containing protein [Chromatiaceae bacterium]